jgi:hypothetical protein
MSMFSMATTSVPASARSLASASLPTSPNSSAQNHTQRTVYSKSPCARTRVASSSPPEPEALSSAPGAGCELPAWLMES